MSWEGEQRNFICQFHAEIGFPPLFSSARLFCDALLPKKDEKSVLLCRQSETKGYCIGIQFVAIIIFSARR
jgi:hypothetical protein